MINHQIEKIEQVCQTNSTFQKILDYELKVNSYKNRNALIKSGNFYIYMNPNEQETLNTKIKQIK